ncbi:unnamed protein product, partial [marine sediment metagenome]
MAEGPIKLKNIACVISGAVATNILTFREEFLMNFTPQFIPNTYPGLGILEKSKWRVLTFTLDSDSDVFINDFSVVAANASLGLIEGLPYDTGSVVFTRGETLTGFGSGATGVVQTWTVTAGDFDPGNDAEGVVYLSGGVGVFG